jgi:hypothetical protein
MQTKTKIFDCLKMKDEAQLRSAKLLQAMTQQQRLDYYQRAHEALVQRRDALRATAGQTAKPSP